jgi:hypothetical protein
MAQGLTILRSGGDFGPQHVQALQRQVKKFAPWRTKFLCLSDMDVPGVDCIPLKHNWPGWWAKLEMYRPDIKGDFLYTDIDNVIVGKIDELLAVGRLTAQIDFWNALTFSPEDTRAAVWNHFSRAPEKYMETFKRENSPSVYGDSGYLKWRLDAKAQHWEAVLPHRVMNIVELRRAWPFGPGLRLTGEATSGEQFRLERASRFAKIILMGQPYRPWLLPQFAKLYWCTEDV